MLTLGLGRMILSVWYRCPPWPWSSSSSVMYSTSSSSSAIAWPCTAVSPVMICKFRQDHKFIESRWNEIKKGSTDAVSDVGSKNTEQMRILQISDCLRKLKNKGTIRQVSTNQRVWDQVNKQTLDGRQGTRREARKMKRRQRFSQREEANEREAPNWGQRLRNKGRHLNKRRGLLFPGRERTKRRMKSRVQIQKPRNDTNTNTKTTRRMKGHVHI